jgi:oligoribonuclease (3'-5' exoribonuclease)
VASNQLLLWIDKETDSLDVRDCAVLEVAGFMTTMDLRVLRGTEFHFLLDLDPEMVMQIRDLCDPIVRDMHDASGLWDALLGKTEGGLDRLSLDLIDKRLASMVAWAQNQRLDTLMHPGEETTCTGKPYDKKPRIAGSGVAAFDLQIVRFQMPELAAALDYTQADVSNARRFYEDICGIEVVKNPERPHRADQDILNAWKEAHMMVARLTGFDTPTFYEPEF